MRPLRATRPGIPGRRKAAVAVAVALSGVLVAGGWIAWDQVQKQRHRAEQVARRLVQMPYEDLGTRMRLKPAQRLKRRR